MRLVLATCVLFAATTSAQPALKNEAPPAPTPAKELSGLKPFFKSWSCTGLDAVGIAVNDQITIAPELDGFWSSLKVEQPATRQTAAISGFAMFGVDPSAKGWVLEGWDNTGARLRLHAPSLANNSLVFEGDVMQPSKTAQAKLTLSLDAKGLRLVVMIGGRKNVDQQCKGIQLDDVLGQMTEFKDRMCSCRDKACVDKVEEDETRRMQELAKAMSNKRDQKPDDAMMKKMVDIGMAKMECKMKASGSTP